MNDFLSRLVERSFAGSDGLRPNLGSIFDPPELEGPSAVFGHEIRPVANSSAFEPEDRDFEAAGFTRPIPVQNDVAPTIRVPDSPLSSPAPLSPAPGLTSPISARPPSDPISSDASAPPREISALEEQAEMAGRAEEPEISPPVVRHEVRPRTRPESRLEEIFDLIRRETGGRPAAPRSRNGREIFKSLDLFRPAARAEEKPDVSPAPSINVTIGRVEIRASVAPDKVAPQSRPAPPRLSLEKYLQERAGGNRR